jgi:hypothetical protein
MIVYARFMEIGLDDYQTDILFLKVHPGRVGRPRKKTEECKAGVGRLLDREARRLDKRKTYK